MFLVNQVNQAVITAPGVGMDDTFHFYFAAHNALQGLLGAIVNDFVIDHSSSLENTENRGFCIGSTSHFPLICLATK